MFYVCKSKLNIIYSVSFIYSNLSLHCYPFSSFQCNFYLSPRTIAFFNRYHRQQLPFPINFFISLSLMSVTTRSDCCHHRQFNLKPSYFHHLAGGRVEAVHEEASPNENTKWNAIHNRSLVPRGRLTRGSVPQILRYIYAPPQTDPDQGMLNRYLPSQEILWRWRA